MTCGWRSPLGGPRYEGDIPGGRDEDPRVDDWREAEIEREIEIREEAEAVAGPEPEADEEAEDDGLRADGGVIDGTITLRWTPPNARPRRVVFEQRSTGGWDRIEQERRRGAWLIVETEIVSDVSLESPAAIVAGSSSTVGP